ncbi:hypothetical protein BDV39DRAFT_205157 [Aspergillus sergii]|uniref:Aldehyde dehydrogenase domain-containing protein n=1 Tax=Aspergillus sergii TaxID=1034303 RepID=A0A5N6X386_9EURO|nr:hypothetical protein BDV39DRAFT_205157 [Aspergillus sergii]
MDFLLQLRPASDAGTFPLKSPASLETVALEDTNDAGAAAQAAFPAWSTLSPHDRGAYMLKLANLLLESEQELAYLEAVSMGRPISDYWDAICPLEGSRIGRKGIHHSIDNYLETKTIHLKAQGSY